MKSFLLLPFILLLTIGTTAQNTFQTKLYSRYDTTWPNGRVTTKIGDIDVYSMTELNGSYYMVGQDDWIERLNGVWNNYGVHGGYFGGFSKISSTGVKTLSKVDIDTKYLNKIIKTSDNNLIIAGRSNDGCWTVCKVGQAIVAKIDTNGAVIWSKGYNGTGGFVDEYLDIYECSDKGVIAVGFTDNSSQYEQSLITKFDSTGNVQWSKISSVPGRVVSVLQLKNSSNFLILTRYRGILKLDKNGNQIPTPKTVYNALAGSDMMQLPNGRILIASYHVGNLPSVINSNAPLFLLTDTNLNVVSSKKYTMPLAFARINSITQRQDGSILAVGQMNDGNYNLSSYRNFVMNVNPQLDVLWAKEYYYNNYYTMIENFDILETPDKGILVGGAYYEPLTYGYSVITKTDMYGNATCLNSKSITVFDSAYQYTQPASIAISFSNVQLNSFGFGLINNTQTIGTPVCGVHPTASVNDIASPKLNAMIYPNPSTDGHFTIELNETESHVMLTVKNMLGQTLFTNEYNNTNKIDMHLDAPAGNYFVEIRNSKGENTVMKWLRE